MNKEEIYQEFLNSGAILNGHFRLASGLHSDTYIQCALLLQDPKRAQKVANELASKIPAYIIKKIDLVIAPAMGGIIIGHEVARQIEKNFIFFERVNNIFVLKRGFTISPGANVLLVEDVITTGGSSMEVVNKIAEFNANVIAEAALVDRTCGKVSEKFNFPVFSLIELDIKAFPADSLPEHLKQIPAARLGSKQI